MNFKRIVIFIKLLTSVVLLRTFGNLIHLCNIINKGLQNSSFPNLVKLHQSDLFTRKSIQIIWKIIGQFQS